MSVKTKVMLAGATGTLGQHILKALLEASSPGFDVSILSRNSALDLDSHVHVYQTDYSDPSQIATLLEGQDVLVSAISSNTISDFLHEDNLLSAAIIAKVPRYFSGEYTLDVTHSSTLEIASGSALVPKIALAERLEREGREGRIEWTTIVCGGFLDWGLQNGFIGFHIKERTATLNDGGKHMATGCTVAFIAACVVRAITSRDEVKNRRVRIAEVRYSGLEILHLLEKATSTVFKIKDIDTEENLFNAQKSGDVLQVTIAVLMRLNYGGSGAANFEDGLGWGGKALARKTLKEIVDEAVVVCDT
ncbi:hypothetical protein MMC34_000475 [Xylographa carneopallida]|nr:hypothetical protein [Xylographa carneopallida]